LLVLSVHSWWSDAQIAKRQQTAIGTIDGHDSPNHNRYHYTFSVNGRQFAGWGSPGNSEFSIGHQIVVYYDPFQPSENSAYGFSEINPGGVMFMAFLLLACVFFPVYIYLQRRSRKGAAGSETDS
jgi:hypothetical protein